MKNVLLSIAVLLLGWSCSTPQETVTVPLDMEFRDLDTLEIVAAPLEPGETGQPEPDSLPVYRPSPTRRHDLLHTRLELVFDWPGEAVLGKATLRLRPYFYPSNSLALDAKGFAFHQVSMVGSEEPLEYEYDGQQIRIQLDKTYERDETFAVYLDYTARPRASGGSSAITSDRGLFFVNPSGSAAGKPQQIWTQGETEHNSRWFPTIDQPNERCTQEVFLTVEDRFLTLSNGLLVSSTRNDDGTRTDYWKMDQPHAPYLFMLAVGEFAVVREEENGIPLAYYVEPEYKADARAIFAHTPEMLRFFSRKLSLQYPWPKYSQVVVRDYVSGAMENTTASVFGAFVQRDRRDLYQENNDRIVAHELFHQWFGNYVTCESWANLTMNEGFANYGEYLWFEYKYGREEADMHLLEERRRYIQSTLGGIHPLIHFQYDEAEDLFDAHSYNKGGAVLHMLRHEVGDEAFFAALHTYLVDNAYRAVEVHDLRLAFERVTGRDLHRFFDQWYLSSGHPELDIRYAYDPDNRKVLVTVKQEQDYERMPGVFRLPSEVEVRYGDLSEQRFPLLITRREQTFSFPVKDEPRLITFDPDHILLCEKLENKTPAQYAYQYRQSASVISRYEALEALYNSERTALFLEALNDPSWHIRELALQYFEEEAPEEARRSIRRMARRDPNAQIRQSALLALAAQEAPGLEELAAEVLEQDSAFAVLAAALRLLAELDADRALPYARRWEEAQNSARMIQAVGQVFAEAGQGNALPFFEQHFQRMEGYASIPFFANYGELLLEAGKEDFDQGLDLLHQIGSDPEHPVIKRYAAAYAFSQMQEKLREKNPEDPRLPPIRERLTALQAEESDPRLKALLDQL